jgi:hypothetical protein
MRRYGGAGDVPGVDICGEQYRNLEASAVAVSRNDRYAKSVPKVNISAASEMAKWCKSNNSA